MKKNKIKNKSVKNNKKVKVKYFSRLFIFVAILFIYIGYVYSYCMNIDGFTTNSFYTVFLKRFIHPIPFRLTFHVYSLLLIPMYLFIYAIWLSVQLKPKADDDWRGIEQGSNHFMDDDELTEFLQNKSDIIIDLNQDEISRIESFNMR